MVRRAREAAHKQKDETVLPGCKGDNSFFAHGGGGGWGFRSVEPPRLFA